MVWGYEYAELATLEPALVSVVWADLGRLWMRWMHVFSLILPMYLPNYGRKSRIVTVHRQY